jgi:hypothetical protein
MSFPNPNEQAPRMTLDPNQLLAMFLQSQQQAQQVRQSELELEKIRAQTLLVQQQTTSQLELEKLQLKKMKLEYKLQREQQELAKTPEVTTYHHPPQAVQESVLTPEDIDERIATYVQSQFDNSKHGEINPDLFEKWCEEYYKKNLPYQYNQLMRKYSNDSYIHRRFTISLKGKPLFITPELANSYDQFISQYDPYMTYFLWYDVIPDSRRHGYRKAWISLDQEKSDRLLFIDDSEILPEDVLDPTYGTLRITTRIQKAGSTAQTGKVIADVGVDDIDLDPNAHFDTNSMLRSDPNISLEDRETFEAKGIRYFNSIVTVYDVNLTYDFPKIIDNTDECIRIFNQHMRKAVAYIYKNRHTMRNSLIQVYVDYLSRDNEDRLRVDRVNIFKGYRIEDLHKVEAHYELQEQLNALGSDAQGDYIDKVLDLSGMKVIITQPIAGGNTNTWNEQKIREFIKTGSKKKINVKVGTVHHIGPPADDNNSCFINIIRTILSDPNNKKYFRDLPNYKRTDTLWKDIDKNLKMKTYKQKITLEEAVKIADYFDINMTIYDLEGKELARSNSYSNLIAYVAYLDDHYLVISDLKYTTPKNIEEDDEQLDEESRKYERKRVTEKLYYAYDLETVYNNYSNSIRQLVPYSLSYATMFLEDQLIDTICSANPYPAPDKPNTLMEEFIKRILEDASIQGKNLREIHADGNSRLDLTMDVVLVAYNGAAFDHYLLFQYLCDIGARILRAPPSNKIIYLTARLNTTKFAPRLVMDGSKVTDRLFINISVWDPNCYLARGLDNAAQAFGLKMSKKGFSHEEVQQAYEEGTMTKWLSRNMQKLKEYNEQDVLILVELTKKLVEAVQEGIGLNPLDYPTIASMCSKFHGSLIYKGSFTWTNPYDDTTYEIPADVLDIHEATENPKIVTDYVKRYSKYEEVAIEHRMLLKRSEKEVVDLSKFNKWMEDINYVRVLSNTTNAKMMVPVKDSIVEDYIRSCIIGGRVEGKVGTSIGKLKMLDVTSEYPYVMATHDFPVGEETVISDIELAKEEVMNIKRTGIFYCRIDQSTLTSNNHPILPQLSVNGTWDWSMATAKSKPIKTWIPYNTYHQLKYYGAKVELISNERDHVAVTWKCSEEGALFAEYVCRAGVMKSQQDELAKKKSKDYNPAIRELGKLLLNSLSGKMIEKKHEYELQFYNDDQVGELSKMLELFASKRETYELTPVSHRMMCLKVKVTPRIKPVQVGIFIYSGARVYMYDLFFSRMLVLYSDTDSAIITENGYERIKNDELHGTNLPLIYNGKGKKHFGMLELEADNFNLFVASPKNYVLYRGTDKISSKSEVLKYRIKGVSKRDKIVLSSTEVVTLEEGGNEVAAKVFAKILQDKELDIETWNFIKNLKAGRLTHVTRIKKLTYDDAVEGERTYKLAARYKEPVVSVAVKSKTTKEKNEDSSTNSQPSVDVVKPVRSKTTSVTAKSKTNVKKRVSNLNTPPKSKEVQAKTKSTSVTAKSKTKTVPRSRNSSTNSQPSVDAPVRAKAVPRRRVEESSSSDEVVETPIELQDSSTDSQYENSESSERSQTYRGTRNGTYKHMPTPIPSRESSEVSN